MDKLWIGCLLVLIVTLVPVFSESCTPESGYAYCYQYEEDKSWAVPGLKVLSRIQLTEFFDDNDLSRDPYYFNSVKITYKCQGYPGSSTKAYLYRGRTSWDQIKCDNVGCNGESLGSNEETYVVSTSRSELGTQGIVFTCWSRTDVSGYWLYGWSNYGWITEKLNKYAVDCVDDSDCEPTGKKCDKSVPNQDGLIKWTCSWIAGWEGDPFCVVVGTDVYRRWLASDGTVVNKVYEECGENQYCVDAQCIWEEGWVGDTFCGQDSSVIYRKWRSLDGGEMTKPYQTCGRLQACKDGECQLATYVIAVVGAVALVAAVGGYALLTRK